jgi:spore coat protein JB
MTVATESRKNCLDKLYEVSFAVNELNLFLDTHPTDAKALELFSEYRAERKNLLQQMAQNYDPMTCDCVDPAISTGTKGDTKYMDQKHFNWVDGPLPWEGGQA